MKLSKVVLLIIIILNIFINLLSMTNEDQRFLGLWTGKLDIMENEIDFSLEFFIKESEIKGYISVPVQMLKNYPLSSISIKYPEIYFEMETRMVAQFKGSLKNDSIIGSFSQPGVDGSFHVIRSEKPDKIVPILEGETDVQIETGSGIIYGSLVVPDVIEKVPVVLIIAGSGPTDRDGNNPMYGEGRIYRNFARKLYENSMASLRFDKRAIGASAAALSKVEDLRFDHYVDDVILWIQFLKKDNRFSEIIVFGHSEGSLIGMIAIQTEPVSAFISAAGAGRHMIEVIMEQFDRQPEPFRSEGLEILESLQQGIMVHNVSDELRPVFRPEIQPYLLSKFHYHPAEEIAKLNMPILIIQGENDIQTTVEDAEVLSQANPHALLKIIKNMNHAFRDSTTDVQETLLTYGNHDLPYSQGFFSSILDFIRDLD